MTIMYPYYGEENEAQPQLATDTERLQALHREESRKLHPSRVEVDDEKL